MSHIPLGEIRGAEKIFLAFKRVINFPAAVTVISRGDNIRAMVEKILCGMGRDAVPRRAVFAVDNCNFRTVEFFQRTEL